jgi:GNAT superfamily N-acetyltransferase
VQLEEQMMEVAEREFAELRPGRPAPAVPLGGDTDDLRLELMRKHGYERTEEAEYKRYCDLTQSMPPLPVPQGYVIRALGDERELPARSWASWTAFHPDEPDSAYEGWEWYGNIQPRPMYRRDLDIVAIAPDGSVASFCTVWYDDHTRTAGFEPVGTDKHHQRRGLARAVMREGQIRAREMGATLGAIGSWNETTHNLYASMGFVSAGHRAGMVKTLVR